MIIIKIILLLIFVTALVIRANVVFAARADWNYYVYRYKHHCKIHYSAEEKPEHDIDENTITYGEAFLVTIMFWKISPHYFFDFKPDWFDIHEMYLLK